MDINHTLRQWALDQKFLHGRMSFICGPRQIGKTTLARNHLKKINQSKNYYNWDSLSLRQEFSSDSFFFIENLSLPLSPEKKLPAKDRQWVVFDEIHKYPGWKNILKGYYDEWKNSLIFTVIGSARLDYFRQSGDSLVGRYFLFKMNPLHPHDLTDFVLDINSVWHPKESVIPFPEPDKAFQEASAKLFDLNGFPEPVSVGTKEFYERWKNDHISLITTEDIRDLSQITQIQKLQTLVFLLPERVGSPLSLNKLKNTLGCAHASVKNWLEALKKVYLVFDLAPYSTRLKRSVLKEPKYYFWDWGLLEDPEKRFENFTAVHLQRAVSAWNEWGKGNYQLMYVRTKDGREVDFVITEKDKPYLLVECKINEKQLVPNLPYFKEKLKAPIAFQVIQEPGFLKQVDRGTFIMGKDRFLQILP
ncbi:MAG: AAA family ATPase [Candidatus Aminicenantes bacterium]